MNLAHNKVATMTPIFGGFTTLKLISGSRPPLSGSQCESGQNLSRLTSR